LAQGCTNVRQLHAELRDRGYRGSYGTVRTYVQPFREIGAGDEDEHQGGDRHRGDAQDGAMPVDPRSYRSALV
jgi:hypothetical protein